ncbi:hypothetical protein [Roseovarius sp. 217]|uniref:hypothetical protein n=1 Tax=Roseovarius sp. (strain 217) TaxID=314264 RepID=UPI000324E9AB|nr:hypothetical protein [Roseovarius sp. 217]
MQALAKALAVLSVTAGLMSGAKALAAPVKVGVSYDLRKPNTTGSAKISQAAVDPIILGVARKVVYLRRLPITTPSCGADVGALEDFHARGLMPSIAVAVDPHDGGQARIEIWGRQVWDSRIDGIAEHAVIG